MRVALPQARSASTPSRTRCSPSHLVQGAHAHVQARPTERNVHERHTWPAAQLVIVRSVAQTADSTLARVAQDTRALQAA